MFELTIGALLGWIANTLLRLRGNKKPTPRYFFNDDAYPVHGGCWGKMSFFTVAEFEETRTVSSDGLRKELIFSDFAVLIDGEAVLIDDEKERIKRLRIKFVGVDGYDRAEAIGYWNHEQLTLRFGLSEYDALFEELRLATEHRIATGERVYFLYFMDTKISKLTDGRDLNEILNFSTGLSYSERSLGSEILGNGFRIFQLIEKGMQDADPDYKSMCSDLAYRYTAVRLNRE